jgi:hypothetical protein
MLQNHTILATNCKATSYIVNYNFKNALRSGVALTRNKRDNFEAMAIALVSACIDPDTLAGVFDSFRNAAIAQKVKTREENHRSVFW